jgi:hypothetical protein
MPTVLLSIFSFIIMSLPIQAQTKKFTSYQFSFGKTVINSASGYEIDNLKSNWGVACEVNRSKSIRNSWFVRYGGQLNYVQMSYLAKKDVPAPEIDDILSSETHIDNRKSVYLGIPISAGLKVFNGTVHFSLGIMPKYAVYQKLFSDYTITSYYTEIVNGGYIKNVPPRVSSYAGEQNMDQFQLDFFGRISTKVISKEDYAVSIYIGLDGSMLKDGSYLRGNQYLGLVGVELLKK